jgi:Ulp1 family protease
MIQARELEEKNEYIEIQLRVCHLESILGLRPDEWIGDELINAATGLVDGPVNSRTFLLSSFLYEHLKNGDFDKADRWVRDFPWEHAIWGFGICEEKHWVAVVMKFKDASILYYDPWEEENPNPSRRKRTLQVSSISNIIASPH